MSAARRKTFYEDRLAGQFAAAYAAEEHQPFAFDAGKDSPAALLVHGFPGTPAEMRPLGEALHAAGWTAHGVLLPGFGVQIGTLRERRMEDWANHTRHTLKTLQQTHPQTLIIGWSMGGALSMQISAELQPDGIVMLSPFWRIDHVLWKLLPAIRRVLPTFKPFRLMKIDFNDPETRKGIMTMMPNADLDDPEIRAMVKQFSIPTVLFDQIRRAGKAAEAAAPRLSSPALVIQGKQDALVKPEITQQLIERLPQKPRYLEVDAEHTLPDSSKPAWSQVREAVLEFAAGVRR